MNSWPGAGESKTKRGMVGAQLMLQAAWCLGSIAGKAENPIRLIKDRILPRIRMK